MNDDTILCYICNERHSSVWYWLVHIVDPPIGLQTTLAPWVLSLAPSLGTLCSVQWMTVSIYFCISQALAEPLRRQLYQPPVSKLLLASAIVSGLVVVYGMDPQVVQSLDGHSFSLCFTLCLCNSFHGYFVPPSKKGKSVHTLVFVLLEFHVFCKFYLVSWVFYFWADIHLSVSTYHVSSFVIGLPHSE